MAAKDHRTVKQTVEERPWLTEPALRSYIKRAELIGLEEAVIRVRKRVLIDLEEFDIWIERGREG